MTRIKFIQVKNDVNGNPRYVCHYVHLLTEKELSDTESPFFHRQYETALNRAREIGGKRFHNKQFGGGIVFTTSNLHNLENRIIELLKN